MKIFAGAKINNKSYLGKNVFLNTGAIIEHDCFIEDHSQVGPEQCCLVESILKQDVS